MKYDRIRTTKIFHLTNSIHKEFYFISSKINTSLGVINVNLFHKLIWNWLTKIHKWFMKSLVTYI